MPELRKKYPFDRIEPKWQRYWLEHQTFAASENPAKKNTEPMRGDIIRALGFFHDPRAYQLLFDNLHSSQVTDRMNSILALKTLGTKEVIPALLAALNDPEVQVRQVANFALEGLTEHKVPVSATPPHDEAQRVAGDWHAWWREHADTFAPPKPAACHDW